MRECAVERYPGILERDLDELCAVRDHCRSQQPIPTVRTIPLNAQRRIATDSLSVYRTNGLTRAQ